MNNDKADGFTSCPSIYAKVVAWLGFVGAASCFLSFALGLILPKHSVYASPADYLYYALGVALISGFIMTITCGVALTLRRVRAGLTLLAIGAVLVVIGLVLPEL